MTNPSIDYEEAKISAMATAIIEGMADTDADPLVKAAACRVAAEVFQQAASRMAIAASINGSLRR